MRIQAGFLGQCIVRQLLERGEDPLKIRVLDVQPPKSPSVGFVKVDISDPKAVDAAFGEPWPPEVELESELTVFHTAAVIRFWERHTSLLHLSSKVNVEGTRNIMDASIKAGASVLLYTSSSAVGTFPTKMFMWPWESYARRKGGVQVMRDGMTLPRDEDQFSAYALTKLMAERMVLGADRSVSGSGSGTSSQGKVLRTGALRPGGIIYGPGDKMLIERFVANETNVTFSPNTVIASIYVENCSLAHLLYEQRLIGIQGQTRGGVGGVQSHDSEVKKNMDIGGQAFFVTDPGPPPTTLDHHNLATIVSGGKMQTKLISPTLITAIAHLVEWYYLSRVNLEKSQRYKWACRFMPKLSGTIVMVQPSTLVTACSHLYIDDERARRRVEEGGLGYRGLCETIEGVCRSILDEQEAQGKRV